MKKVVPALLVAVTLALVVHTLQIRVIAQQSSTPPLNYFKTVFVTGDFFVEGVGLNQDGTGDITVEEPALVGKDVVAAFLYWQAITRTDTPNAGGVGAYFKGHPLSTAQGIFAKSLGPGTPTCSSGGGGTGNSQGSKRAFTYRMDVLRYFDVDQAPGPNFGKLKINDTHSVQLPISNTVEPIGASLVVMYRDENEPLRAVVIYDGAFAMDQSTNGMQLTMQGIYDGTPGPAKLAIIGGNGQANKNEITRFNGAQLSDNAFNSFLGPKWDNPTFDVVTPGPPMGGYTDQVTVSVAKENLGTFDCVTFAAAIYSTAVNDGDDDGLLNRWEASATPLYDPNNQPLLKAANGSPTTLSAMGADPGVKDVFVEIGYMEIGPQPDGPDPDTDPDWPAYGGVPRPPHSHRPTHETLKLVGDAFKGTGTTDRVRIHFDMGPNYPLGHPTDPKFNAEQYLVPRNLARGGEGIDEATTVCTRTATDPEYVCQFGNEEGESSLAFPGTVGWKTGYRFIRDEVFSISPALPNNLPAGETADDYCGQIANPNTGQRYVCERRFDEGRFNIFRFSLFIHHVGLPKSEFACLLNGVPVHADVNDMCVSPAVPNPDFHVPVTSSGIGDFPGGDSQVALGGFLDGTGKPIGTPLQQAGTLMHELGHNFLRRHGGGAFEPNCKPTYLSVMNYLYQMRGLLKDDDSVKLDYSDDLGGLVNEAGLDENVDSPNYRLGWFAPLSTSYLAGNPNVKIALKHCNGSDKIQGEVPMVRVDAPTSNEDIDWDADSNPATTLYAPEEGALAVQDVNYSGGAFDDVLAGSADWPNLKLNQLGIRRNVGALYLDPDTNLFTVGPTSVGMGKGDAGKGDAGATDLGKGDAGKGDAGKGDAGKGDAGKGDAGKGDAGKGDAGGGDLFTNDPNNPPGELDVDTAGEADNLRRPINFEACVSGFDCASSTAPLHDVQITFDFTEDANPVSYTVFRVLGAALAPEADWVAVATIPHVTGVTAYAATDDTAGLVNGAEYTYFARANYEIAEDVFAPSEITRRDPITVIDDPALAVNHQYSTNEDVPLVVAAPGVLAGSGDPDDDLVFTAELVSGLSPATAGTLVLNANGSFTFTPSLNFSSATAVTFTYRAVSGAIVTNTATVSITVSEVNDPPTVSDIPDQTIYQNGTTGPLAFSIGDVENAAGLTVSGTSSNTALVPNANIVFGGAGGNRTVTVTPVANTTGAATITILVNDGIGGVASDTFVLNVLPPPTLVGIQNVPPATVKTVNPGSSVPMVWEYRVGSTVVDSASVHHTVTIAGPANASYSDTDSGSSYFRYDPTTRRWSFNLQTKTPSGQNYPSGNYTVTITPQTSGFVGTSFTLRLR